MPPSPALRFSPYRELNHKRGRSLDGGLHLKDKCDDLALFTDMQNRERENFLLHSSGDIDDDFSTKLKYFSDLKLGVSIPVRGESSDLFNADGDKNDYDWLLTPPDTPLFPSLDDEDEKQPVNLVQRGRPRSQPIHISRTSLTEKSYRSGRSSASPHRLSPSPRSSNNSYLSRGRPSSAPRTSPGPVLRSNSPSQRSSAPDKPSTTTPRSSTPTLRRMSTGVNATPSSAKRSGASPGKATRGNSASPKLQTWQSTLPGFSSDPPPNLRTSSDWPVSHVRGVSPASRNGRDASYSKYRRQSMSPTASRSASSSHSHDRDRFSSNSKCSIASSGDDDMDSLQSAPVSQQSTARKTGSFPSNRNISLSKKPSRTLSVGSAPKRSFDYALRQMDNRKGPQNMFRPLLSSVPSTTFYAGKVNPTHYPIISRNSSITTSSNASSEQGVSIALDTEGSEHDQDDLNSEWVKTPYSDNQEEEIFVLDRAEEVKGRIMDADGKLAEQHGGFGKSTSSQAEARDCEAISSNQPAVITAETCSPHLGGEPSEVASGSVIVHCSVCYSEFQTAEHINDDSYICPNCSVKSGLMPGAPASPVSINQDDVTCGMHLEENNSVEMDADSIIAELPEETDILAMSIKNEASVAQDIIVPSLDNLKEDNHCLLYPERVGSLESNSNGTDYAKVNQQLHYIDGLSSSKADNAECLGISVLLKRSNSTKWPVVQGRAFTASTISCDNLSYMRDNLNSVRNYSVEGSASASSSVDLSSHAQRQLGGKNVDMDIMREDINRMLLSSRSSVSGFSDNSYGAIVYSEGISEGRIDYSAKTMEIEGVEDAGFVPKENQVLEGKEFDLPRIVVSSASDLSTPARDIQLNDSLVAGIANNEDFDFRNALEISDDSQPYVCMERSKIEEADTMYCSAHCLTDRGDPLCNNVVMVSGEPKDEREEGGLPSNPDNVSFQHSEHMDCVPDEPLSSTTEKGGSISALETDIINQSHNLNEEAMVTIEGVRGHKTRSLTLEEATDTILFCSSIVHDLAYEAATIAIEKERPLIPLDVYRQTPASLFARSSMKDSDSHRRPKAAKARHKRTDSAVKPPSQKTENDVQSQETLAQDVAVSHKPDSMKPPKLESKCNCTIM